MLNVMNPDHEKTRYDSECFNAHDMETWNNLSFSKKSFAIFLFCYYSKMNQEDFGFL